MHFISRLIHGFILSTYINLTEKGFDLLLHPHGESEAVVLIKPKLLLSQVPAHV